MININRKEQQSLFQKSLLKCVFLSFPWSFEWAFATCGGCHSYPQGTTAALSPSNRKWPASSWREGLVWSWSWSLISSGLRDKGGVSVSPYKPRVYPKLLSFRNTLGSRFNSACFIFSSLTLVSQMWMSVKLVPTTATCMPHVWMSPEASSAAAEKAGWETASNVLVSLRKGKPFSTGQHFCVALPCTHVNQHSNGHSLFAFYLFSCKSKLSLVAGIIPVWAFP